MDNLENKTSAEIGILLDEKSKQISEFLKFHHKVEQEKLLLQRDILDLTADYFRYFVNAVILSSSDINDFSPADVVRFHG